MLNPLKRVLQRIRTETSFADKLQLIGVLLTTAVVVVTIFTLFFVRDQVRENTKTNKVSIRAQLYQKEADLLASEAGDNDSVLSTNWALVPYSIQGKEYGAELLQLVTSYKPAIESKNAAELYHSIFDAAVFGIFDAAVANDSRRNATRHLRRLFFHTQASFYHIHNAFDYNRDRILSDKEWLTWKGLIREMNAHPITTTKLHPH